MWKIGLNRTVEHLRRYRHITAVLMKYGFEEAADVLVSRLKPLLGARAKPVRVKRAAQSRSRPERVRLAMEELGPTFIKLGQLLSTRPDLIPPEYVKELELLQDRVAPEKFERVQAEIERELGGKLEEIFAEFNPVPIAAGSIAQVHRATTRDGRAAVIKVLRPGVAQTIKIECEMLENLAGFIKAAFRDTGTLDPQRMVKEFSDAVSKEVDLANERRNQLRFLRSFAADTTVHVPQIYEEYCSRGVLTMEYIDGIKPAGTKVLEKAGLEPKIIAKRGADFVLRQIFDLGFFHTDPHPGNFFILPGNVLAPIDFGQVARLSLQDRRLLTEMVPAIVDNDITRVVQALQREEMLEEQTDKDKLMRDIEELLAAYHDLPIRDIPLGKAIGEGFELMRKHSIRPPAEFTLMLKSLMTIESFATSLDPDFQIVEQLKPYAQRFSFEEIAPSQILRKLRKTMRDAGEMAVRFPEDLNTIINKFRRGQFQMRVQHEHLENLTHTLDKSSNRISFALIIAGLLVGSSMLVSQERMALGVIHLQTLGILGYIVAAIMGISLLISILRSRHY